MADETTIDLTKMSAGAWSLDELQGMPVGTFEDRLFARCGIEQTNALRKDLVVTHPSDVHAVVPRIPADFDPGNYAGPLVSAQDWLTMIGTLDTSPKAHPAAAPVAVATQEPIAPVVQEQAPIAEPPRTEPVAFPGAAVTNNFWDAVTPAPAPEPQV